MPKISVVVPVYNTEKYLIQCLDSLVNQTYKDIEIICVNDGSTDKSLEILNEYKIKDDRIVIINQENAGLYAVLNNAIQAAKGYYITFVDSDDWSELNACEIMIKTANEYDPDVVMFSYYREYENKTLTKNIFDQDLIIFDEDACKKLHRRHAGIINQELRHPENADALCSICTKLFKTHIFKDNDIKRVDNKIIGTYGDGLFNLFYFKYVKKAVFINKYLYHYRKTNEDSHTSKYKANLPELWDNLFNIMENYIKDNQLGSDFSMGLSNRIAIGIIGLSLNISSSNKTHYEKYKEIKTIMKKQNYRVAFKNLKIRYMAFHWKVFFLCCKLRLYLLVYLMIFLITKLKAII